MEKGSEIGMNWMVCVITSVKGPRFVSLSDDSFYPLNRMPKGCIEEIVSMDVILELPMRN